MEALLGIFPTAIDLSEAKRFLNLPFDPPDQWRILLTVLSLVTIGLATFGAFELMTGR
jgi:hypothetical protein